MMQEKEKNNTNMTNFENRISEICGERIGLDHIHIGSGRGTAIQPPVKGAPMLLRHYNGMLFIDLHEDDFHGLKSGKLDAMEFINSAKWLVGFYLGSYGGYYQPIDILNCTEEFQRYLRIWNCRVDMIFEPNQSKELRCKGCTVENCPIWSGCWEDEPIKKTDPRKRLLKALDKRFGMLYPGYTLRLLNSSWNDGDIGENKALVRAFSHYEEEEPFGFVVTLDSKLVRELLSHEIVFENDDQADEFVKSFRFFHSKVDMEGCPEVTIAHIKEIFSKPGMDFAAEEKKKREEILESNRKFNEEAKERAKWGIFAFLYDLFH